MGQQPSYKEKNKSQDKTKFHVSLKPVVFHTPFYNIHNDKK
jgi:hypothetical protein